jgi:uncharacterized protein YdaU (DUF1376 family)
MTKSPAFQFYPNDWLSSARIATMTAEQEGAYIRLLCYCWNSGDCSIPNDEDVLLSLSRLKNKDDLRVVAKCFNQHPTDATKLVHERLISEHEKQQKWREKSRDGGKKSAAKRIEKQEHLKGGSRVVQPKVNSSSSFSSSSSYKNNTPIIPTWIPIDDWNDWIASRKKKPTQRAIELSIKRLEQLKNDGHDPKEVLQQSIINGWTGLFETKKKTPAKVPTNTNYRAGAIQL